MVNPPSISSVSGMKRSKSKLGRSSKSKTSYSTILESDFDLYFRKLYNQENISNILNIAALQEEPSFGILNERKSRKNSQISSNVYNIITIYENVETKSNLQKVIIRNIPLHEKLMMVLDKALKNFSSISILKLEHCNLNLHQIKMLKKILRKNLNITELSIAGNPDDYQNFHGLLKKNKLEYLSMKLCKINDNGVQKIADELSEFDHPLIYLNLSSNFITSEGANYLSKMLRVNRNLQGLNLCDNWIRDEGCLTLMNALKKFSLFPDEIYVRRKRMFDYLTKRNKMLIQRKESNPIMISQNTSKSNSSKKNLVKSPKDNKSRSSRGNSLTTTKRRTVSASNIKKATPPVVNNKALIEEIDRVLGKDIHPFVEDSQPADFEIFCAGNLSLVHLNLSYNKITKTGIKEILNTLIYQGTVITCKEEGLTSLVLEGNSKECDEKIIEISQIIYHKLTKSYTSVINLSCKSPLRTRKRSSRKSI